MPHLGLPTWLLRLFDRLGCSRPTLGWWVTLSLLAPIACLLYGPQHDYIPYMSHWQAVIDGKDAWKGFLPYQDNAYGPAYLLFALPYALHPLLPKLTFTLAWLGAAYGLIVFGLNKGLKSSAELRGWVWFFLACPFFWRMTVDQGYMDVWISVSMLVAIHWRQHRPSWSAIALGMGCLLKFYPLILWPVMAFGLSTSRSVAGEARRGNRTTLRPWLELRYCLIFFATVLAGFGVAYALYGQQVLNPFLLMGDRPSKGLSIFRFLRGQYSPLQLWQSSPNLDSFSLTALTLGLICVFTLYHLRWPFKITGRAPCKDTGRKLNDGHLTRLSLIVILTTLALFKVGHTQFYLPLFFLYPYHLFSTGMSLSRWWQALFAWLTFVNLMYSFTGGFLHQPGPVLLEAMGLINLVILLGAGVSLLKENYSTKTQPRDPQSKAPQIQQARGGLTSAERGP